MSSSIKEAHFAKGRECKTLRRQSRAAFLLLNLEAPKLLFSPFAQRYIIFRTFLPVLPLPPFLLSFSLAAVFYPGY